MPQRMRSSSAVQCDVLALRLYHYHSSNATPRPTDGPVTTQHQPPAAQRGICKSTNDNGHDTFKGLGGVDAAGPGGLSPHELNRLCASSFQLLQLIFV